MIKLKIILFRYDKRNLFFWSRKNVFSESSKTPDDVTPSCDINWSNLHSYLFYLKETESGLTVRRAKLLRQITINLDHSLMQTVQGQRRLTRVELEKIENWIVGEIGVQVIIYFVFVVVTYVCKIFNLLIFYKNLLRFWCGFEFFSAVAFLLFHLYKSSVSHTKR